MIFVVILLSVIKIQESKTVELFSESSHSDNDGTGKLHALYLVCGIA